MDFKAIDAAIEHYLARTSDEDKARLTFFRGLWDIQQRAAERLAEANPYSPEDAETLERHYWDETAALLTRPVSIDAAEFARMCADIAAHMSAQAGLDEQAAAVLAAYDWEWFSQHSALELAGKDPAGYIEDCLRRIDYFGVDAACPSNVFMMVPTFALRAFLQGPAQQVMDTLRDAQKNQMYHDKPLRCPVCGSPAAASLVGGGLELESHARELYCSTCGTRWPFERIRCGCCGTRNQSKLHWVHVEGDDAHRLHLCDACGDYMRTVFRNELGFAICMEVEDVAMTFLDQVAQSIE